MPLALAERRVVVTSRGDARYLSSAIPLDEPPRRLFDPFRRTAETTPERDFLLERRGDGIRRVTYGEALRAAEGVAAWLVETQPEDARVMALSGNSVSHALLMLGCFLAGVPFVPVSPAYSLMSRDFAKLRVVHDKVRPAVVYVEARGPFEKALEHVDATIVDATIIDSIARRTPTGASRAREAAVTPGHVAKILFTSGSTAFPKGVPNTHRMLTANQQMIAQLWPFLDGAPPVLVDWLPWSHTFGGNHDFNLVLFHGGTLFVDEGRPADALVGATLRNLRDVPPTLYFNVPAGYAALVPRLEADDDLRRAFFSRLRVMFYAGAALSPDLWTRLVALAKRSDADVFMTTAWGSTETSPLATSTHFVSEVAGNIGLPAPGVTLKLVPSGTKTEVRVKGPNVMAGYLDEPELTAAAFDDEGFYRIGDAVRFANPDDPSAGLLFDGRVAEDFKLSSGTWVSVATVRTGLLAHADGALADVVVCGHDRDALAVLAWPNLVVCKKLLGTNDVDAAAVAGAVRIRERVLAAMRAWNAANPGSSTRVMRVLLLVEPPSIDAGEITDKGYTNQRATIERRAADVARVYAATPAPDVIVFEA